MPPGCRWRVHQITTAQADKLGGQSEPPEIKLIDWENKRTGRVPSALSTVKTVRVGDLEDTPTQLGDDAQRAQFLAYMQDKRHYKRLYQARPNGCN